LYIVVLLAILVLDPFPYVLEGQQVRFNLLELQFLPM
ncbi:MAG: hypothetical protein EZS28_043821, partial [Streblomastix strix]